jgi:hypothetical protein
MFAIDASAHEEVAARGEVAGEREKVGAREIREESKPQARGGRDEAICAEERSNLTLFA